MMILARRRRTDPMLCLLFMCACVSMTTTHAFSFSPHNAPTPFLATRRTTRATGTSNHSPLFVASTSEEASSDENTNNKVRNQLRRLTGFSLTAARATLRVTTGVSSQVTKRTLSIFPLWLRFFFQPFLVLYYWPLIFLRGSAQYQAASVQQEETVASSEVEDEEQSNAAVLESTAVVLEPSKTIKELVMAEIDQLVQSTTTPTTGKTTLNASSSSSSTAAATSTISGNIATATVIEEPVTTNEVLQSTSSVLVESEATTTATIANEQEVDSPSANTNVATPTGARWSTASESTDLSGTWSLIVDDTFKAEYDAYLSSLGQPAIVRSVACTIVGFTKEEYQQIDNGKKLTIVGTNPRGKWERVLISSTEDDRVETPVQTADAETVMAEAWWEEEGTRHISWMRGGKKWGGGDFESIRYLECDTDALVCDTVFHPTDEFREKSYISWKFRRVD